MNRKPLRSQLLPDSPHPYYIAAPPYVSTSAGVKCQHLLCHHLNLKGQTAYIVLDPYHIEIGSIYRNGPDLLTPLLTQEIADRHHAEGKRPIAVYSEIFAGNPFEAGCVVRFFFNYPSWSGVTADLKTSELRFGYSSDIASAALAPDNVLYIPNVDTRLFHPPDVDLPRSGTCFYADKFRKVHKSEPFAVTASSIEITRDQPTSQSTREVADLFRRSEIFYVYENTSLAIEAVLCGCPVVFVTNPFLKGIIGLDHLGSDGFAWGLGPDELAKAIATVANSFSRYETLIKRFDQDLDRFIEKTVDFARSSSRPSTPFYIPLKTSDQIVQSSQDEHVAEKGVEHHPGRYFNVLPLRLHRTLAEILITFGMKSLAASAWHSYDRRVAKLNSTSASS